MYETRNSVLDAVREHQPDTVLADSYTELTFLYRIYQQAVLALDKRYIPQVFVPESDGVDVQYFFPALDHLFEQRERNEAPPPTGDDRTDEDAMDMLRATLQAQRDSLEESLVAQWLAFRRICEAIADNVYVKQFYHKPLFTYLAERITAPQGALGTIYFPTQESHLTQYRLSDGLVYYNGKPYSLGNDWSAKRAQILDKLLSFENPFP